MAECDVESFEYEESESISNSLLVFFQDVVLLV